MTHYAEASENWDDDFEFNAQSARSSPSAASNSNDHDIRTSPPRPRHVHKESQSSAENWDDFYEDDTTTHATTSLQVNAQAPHHESSGSSAHGDDESVNLRPHPAHVLSATRTPRANKRQQRVRSGSGATARQRPRSGSRASLSSSEEELGFADGIDEDRTVTAHNRRVFSHTISTNSSPPPPVPPLPATVGYSTRGIGLGALSVEDFPQPFPRSPTTSVFSAPETISSTTGLIGGTGRRLQKKIGPGLAGLPPSPPIHRERRRLRKKSRPAALTSAIEVSRASSSSGAEEEEEDWDAESPASHDHQTDSLLSPSSTNNPYGASTSSISMQPAAAAQAPMLPPGGMLSRIGSMKRWGRRKKGSSMSVGSEMEAETDVIRDITADINADLTPRRSMSQRSPSSSCSRNRHSYHTGTPSTPARRGSLYTLQTPPNPSSNSQPKTPAIGDNGGWFLRGPSPGRRRFRSRSTSRTRDERRPHTPTPLPDFSGPKSKLLVKQHPGGFIPIGRGRHPRDGDEKTAGRSLHPSPTKYGALGVGRPSSTGVGSSSVEDLGRKMGFVERSVRKISLVGGQKHKRTKSAAGLEETDQPSSTTPGLEIQPPSPPQTMNAATGSRLTGTTFSLASTTSLPSTALQPSKSPLKSNHSRPVTPVMQVHPQSTASLGRSSAAVAAAITSSPSAMRRNSLGDLKIPARISQAQGALRRDLGMVREFARNVEDLKELQSTYQSLVAEVQAVLDARLLPAAPTSPSPSPSFFKRHRSNASLSTPPPEAWKQLAAAFYTINSRYRISWECAELLIELGGAGSSAGPPSSTSAPAIPPTSTSSKKSRARAITLTDDSAALPTSASLPTASTPSLAWRASTGRSMHSNAELNSRQMALLKELLSSPSAADDSFGTDDGVPEGTVVNRDWRWGADAMGSTITLPSEEDHGSGKERVKEKRRKSSKMRMSGFRDLLKSLARSGSGGASSSSSNPSHHPNPIPSTTSFSTDSSSQSRSTHNSTHSRRRAKTSTGPEIISLKPGSPYNSAKTASASPRRPSLASIFRIGRNKTPTGMPNESSSEGVSHDEGEDWDRLSSEAEQQHPQQTIRGRNRSPYLHPALLPNSNTSLGANGATVVTRITRLSNVNETVEDASQPPSPVFSPPPPTGTKTTRRRAKNTGSVRSMPPSASSSDAVLAMMTAGKLAMTPENIKPLLENAREVHARLMECIEEVRALVDGLENQKV